MNTDRKTEQFLSIQYLRAIAALLVVLHHARNPAPWLFNPLEHYRAFAWGVDIFFVISGFIMYVAARHESPGEFLKKRFIRVAPLYWAATLSLLVIQTKLNLSSVTPELWAHVLRSIAFVPHFSPYAPEQIWPYLKPGWTLNYEMFFYFIFFIALVIRRQIIIVVSAVLLLLTTLGTAVHFECAIALTYTSPIMLEFLFGIWIALFHIRKGGLPKWYIWLLPIGLYGLILSPFSDENLLGRIIFSTMIVAGAVSIGARTPRSTLGKLLGDASYSIYLTHSFLSIGIASNLSRLLPIDGWPQFLTHLALSLAISIIVGVIVHIIVEKPMLSWCRDHLIFTGKPATKV